MRSLSPDLNFRELFSAVPSTISFDIKFSEDEDYIFIFSDEKVALNFSYLNEKRFFDLNTVNILNLDRMEIMLSFIKGIGILGRGGPLKYISTEISSLIGSSLFDSPTMFEVGGFSNEEMQWQKWGGDLLGITFGLPDIKIISIEGKEIESKIKDLKIKELDLYPNEDNKITKIKIYNKNFSRRITVERNGKIKMALWPGEIKMHEFSEGTSFSTFSEKMIELYEYIEEALGEESW